MNNNSYEQFFTKAQKVKREEPPVDKIHFSLKERPTAAKVEREDKRLRQHLNVKRVKPPFPWKAVAGLGVTLFVVGVYVVSPDAFENLLNKVEIRAMGSASAEEKAAEKSKVNFKEKEKPAAPAGFVAKTKGPEEKSAVADELSHFDKLKQRKEELDQREKELTELEEELQRQKVELDKRITQLEGMRNQIGQTLKERVDVDQEKVNKLVDLYSNMKPKQAADIIGSINEELAVEVLAKMKKKNAAEVMNLLPQDKARILSEKYTGYRRISSQDTKGQ